MPAVCHRRTESNPVLIAGQNSAPCMGTDQTETKTIIMWDFAAPAPMQIMAYPLSWLTLITITAGMYVVNGYEVVKVFLFP